MATGATVPVRTQSAGHPSAAIFVARAVLWRDADVSQTRMTSALRFVSPHGTHLPVGVGSVWAKVLLGGMRNRVPAVPARLSIPSFVVVALEQSNRYFEAAAVTAVAVAIQAYVVLLPGVGRTRVIHRWAAGYGVDRRTALEATYSRARGATVRQLVGPPVWGAVSLIVVGVIAGATLSDWSSTESWERALRLRFSSSRRTTA